MRLGVAALGAIAVVIPAAALGQDPGSSDLSDPGSIAAGFNPYPDGAPPQGIPDNGPTSEELTTPEAQAQRENSQLAFADASATDAEELLERKFSDQLDQLDQDPLRSFDPGEVQRFLSDHVALVEGGPDAPGPQMIESNIPLRAPEGGRDRAVDLDLESDGGHFEAHNPVTDISMPSDLGEPLRLQRTGVGLQLDTSEAADASAHLLEGDKLFYHEAAEDTDVLIAPTSLGAELSLMIRSAEAPGRLGFHVSLPEGAELRDAGEVGLEIVRGGERIAMISAPWAVDAQGATVDSHLEKTGPQSFDLITEMSGHAMPIYVDPAVEDWYANSWQWGGNGNFSGWASSGATFSAGYSCALNGYTACWGNPPYNGLYLFAGQNWEIPNGAWREWYYVPPGSSSYVSEAHFFSINFARGGDNAWATPYAFWGTYATSTAQWTNYNAYGGGNIAGSVNEFAASPPTNMAVFGLGNNANRTGSNKLQGNRSAALGAMLIKLGDQENPALSLVSGAPTTQWYNGSEHPTITANASDAGLGVQRIFVSHDGGPKQWPPPNAPVCGGTWTTGACPASVSGRSIQWDATALAQGKSNLKLTAMDPLGKANTISWPVKVDRTSPEISLSDQLANATGEGGPNEDPENGPGEQLSLPSYKLGITATDGDPSKTGSLDQRSGVKSIEVHLDDKEQAEPVNWTSPLCSPSNCTVSKSYELLLPDLSAGPHTLTVVVTDNAGNSSQRRIEFQYRPKTGIADDQVMQYVDLEDGHQSPEGGQPPEPELAVNVANGNLVYQTNDVDVQGQDTDLKLDRVYNSQLPESENTEWGDGWTLAETPKVTPYTPFLAGATRTFEGWAKRDTQTSYDTLISGTSEDAGAPYLVLGGEQGLPASTVAWRPAGGLGQGVQWSSAWPGTGQWVHWALVVNQAAHTVELFVNGQSKGKQTVATPYAGEPGEFNLGAWRANGGSSYAFDGKLDEAAIYDYALTPNAIRQHYGQGLYEREVKSASPSLYWRLGETSGGIAADSSGNGQAGTFSPSLAGSAAAHHVQGALAPVDDDGAIDVNGSDQWVDSTYGTRRNLVTNPSFETDVAGWSSWFSPASSVARTTSQAQTGAASLKATAQPTGQGVVYGMAASAGKSYSVAAQLRGGTSAGLKLNLLYVNSSLQTIRNDIVNVNASGGWTRAVANASSYGPAPTGTIGLWVIVNNAASTAQDFYVDSVQIEQAQEAAPYFDGSSAQARWEGANNASVSVQDGAFMNGSTRTFEGWAKRDANSTLDTLLGGSGSSPPRLRLEAGSNDVSWRADSQGGAAETWSGAWPGNGQWVHFALVFDEPGDSVSLYINGSLVSTKPDTDQVSVNAGEFMAGARGMTPDPFDGKLDEVAVYDHALSAPQIALHYGQGLYEHTIKADHPSLYWRLGEGSGAAAADSSGHSRAGAYAGAPAQHVAGGLQARDDDGAVDLNGTTQYVQSAPPSASNAPADPVELSGPTGDNYPELPVAAAGEDRFEPDPQATLNQDSDGGYELTDETSAQIYELNPDGQTEQLQAPNDSSVNYDYGSDGSLDQISTDESDPGAEEHSVDVETDGGLVTEVSGDEAGDNTYEHTGDDLTSQTGEEGTTSYEYDPDGHMTKVTLPNGTYAEITYDSVGRAKTIVHHPESTGTTETTVFDYSDDPRRTNVTEPNGRVTKYFIQADGTILNTVSGGQPPVFDDLGGSVYAAYENHTPLDIDDQNLLITARSSASEIASIQVLKDGDAQLYEKTCDVPNQDCGSVSGEWVTSSGAHAPGSLDLEVLATDALGNTTSERFTVEVPYTPPPPANEPPPPDFQAIKSFREAYGLDLDLDPVSQEEELNQRIWQLRTAWYTGDPVARWSFAKWGVPLRPVDVAELEFRERYIAQAADVIPQWVASHASSTFAGYYVDHAAGGIIYVGFTQDQADQVAALKQTAGLLAPDRIQPFPNPPARSMAYLTTLQTQIGGPNDPQLSGLVTTAAIDVEHNRVIAGATNVSQATTILNARYPGGAVTVEYHPVGPGPKSYSRYQTHGPVQAGDYLYFGCTAAFSGADFDNFDPIRGTIVLRYFVLSAGHCFPLSNGSNGSVNRVPLEALKFGPPPPPQKEFLGNVTRHGYYYYGSDGYSVDAEAIKVDPDLTSTAIYIGPEQEWQVHGVSTMYPGQTVCSSGSTLGFAGGPQKHCGPVRSDGPIRANYGGRWFWQVTADIPDAEGDSGGPIWDVATGQAVGILSTGLNEQGTDCEPCPITGVTPLLPFDAMAPLPYPPHVHGALEEGILGLSVLYR